MYDCLGVGILPKPGFLLVYGGSVAVEQCRKLAGGVGVEALASREVSQGIGVDREFDGYFVGSDGRCARDANRPIGASGQVVFQRQFGKSALVGRRGGILARKSDRPVGGIGSGVGVGCHTLSYRPSPYTGARIDSSPLLSGEPDDIAGVTGARGESGCRIGRLWPSGSEIVARVSDTRNWGYGLSPKRPLSVRGKNHVSMSENVGEPVHDGDAVGELDQDAGDERCGDDDREHLQGLDEGAGCTEIWEHLSERRKEE